MSRIASRLKNLTVGAKLTLAFGAIEFLMIVLGVFSMMELSKVNGGTLDIARNWLPRVRAVADLRFDTASYRRDTLNYLLAVDKREHYDQKTNDDLALVAEDEKRYEAMISSDAERKIYQDFRNNWDPYVTVNTQVKDLSRSGKAAEATSLMQGEGAKFFLAGAKTLQQDVEFNDKGAMEAANKAEAAYESCLYLVIGLAALAVVLGFAIAAVLARTIAFSMAKMLAMIRQVAANNLAVADLEITSGDEIGQAAVALNQMKNNLHGVVHSIAQASEQVAAASEELSLTSENITANSEETSAQASVVSQTVQTVHQNLQTVADGTGQMGTSINEIARNAGEAAKIATAAVSASEAANSTVSKLGESSNEIGAVVNVITAIAQQTNLLALNATIEAARAGEAGKGFAVVANEVKELAKQTAKATGDIGQKIEALQKNAKAAIEAIATIGEVINQVNGYSNTIAAAVEEQNATTNEMSRSAAEAASSSAEISSNIAGVATAAESTAKGASDTQRAAQALVQTAATLQSLVAQFRSISTGRAKVLRARSARSFRRRLELERRSRAASGGYMHN